MGLNVENIVLKMMKVCVPANIYIYVCARVWVCVCVIYLPLHSVGEYFEEADHFNNTFLKRRAHLSCVAGKRLSPHWVVLLCSSSLLGCISFHRF